MIQPSLISHNNKNVNVNTVVAEARLNQMKYSTLKLFIAL